MREVEEVVTSSQRKGSLSQGQKMSRGKRWGKVFQDSGVSLDHSWKKQRRQVPEHREVRQRAS